MSTRLQRTALDFRIAAQDYVDRQLEVMRRYGSDPIISPAEYEGIVYEIEQVGRKLWLASGGTILEYGEVRR